MCTLPGPSGAPRILQDEEVHSELHQVPLNSFSRHAAVHGVDQLGSLPARKQCDVWWYCYNTHSGGQLESHFTFKRFQLRATATCCRFLKTFVASNERKDSASVCYSEFKWWRIQILSTAKASIAKLKISKKCLILWVDYYWELYRLKLQQFLKRNQSCMSDPVLVASLFVN